MLRNNSAYKYETAYKRPYQITQMCTVIAVIADKNVVTKITNNSTGLQHIVFNSFAKRP